MEGFPIGTLLHLQHSLVGNNKMPPSHMPVSAIDLNLDQHHPALIHPKQPRRHIVCSDIWEIIFDLVQDFTDVNVPPILAACAQTCRDLRPIAEGRLYTNLIIGDSPTVESCLFRQARPICTTGFCQLLRNRHMETTNRKSPTYFPLNGNYPMRQQSATVLMPSVSNAWYSLHPIELYRILKRSPYLNGYIRTVNVWPSDNRKGYNEDRSEVFSYLLSLPTREFAFHEFENGLPYYITDHLENTSVPNLDFSGVKNFQVNSLLRLIPIRRLGLATIDTEIVNPICDFQFNLKVELEILAIDFSDWPSAERFYHWFFSPACPVCVTSIVSLELTWVGLKQLLMDIRSRGLLKPIYWLFMALLNIRDLSIQVSDTIRAGEAEAWFKPYPRPFQSIPHDRSFSEIDLNEDFTKYGALMTTSGFESLKNLQTVIFAGTFYDLSLVRLRDGPGHASDKVRSCLIAFRHLLQSLKQRGPPSTITAVTFAMDFDYSPVFTYFPGTLKLPVLSEWQGVVDMLLSQAHMPNLGKVVFTIRRLPKHAKEGEDTRIKEAFSALPDIRRLVDKNLVVWKN